MMCTLAAQLGSNRNAWQSPTGHDLIIFMVVDLIGSNQFLGVSLALCGLDWAQESGILSDVPWNWAYHLPCCASSSPDIFLS